MRHRSGFRADDDDDDGGSSDQRNQAMADHSGRPTNPSRYRQAGRRRFTLRQFDFAAEEPAANKADESQLFELRRRVSKVLTQYRVGGMFSEFEMKLMELLFDGVTTSEVGRRYNMSRQAVGYHVLRVLPRAPLFRRFWRLKNLTRHRTG